MSVVLFLLMPIVFSISMPVKGSTNLGSPTTAGDSHPILFDAMHDPLYDNESSILQWFWDDYGAEFDYKATGTLTDYLLSQYSGLFIMNSHANYTEEEISVITNFIRGGGKVFLAGEYIISPSSFLGIGARTILTEYGFSFGDLMEDSDDGNMGDYWVVYNASNIAENEITHDVEIVLPFASAYFTNVPDGTQYLITSDNDGTATEDYAPIMTQTRMGMGELTVFMDTSIFSNGTQTLEEGLISMKDYGDNNQLVDNIVSWLSTRKQPNKCLVDCFHYNKGLSYVGRDSTLNESVFLELYDFCDFNIHTELTLDLLLNYNALLLPNSLNLFTSAEKYALGEFMDNGGKIFCIADRESFTGNAILEILEEMGFDWNGTLTDSDDFSESNSWVNLTDSNFYSSTFFNNIDDILFAYGGVITSDRDETIGLLRADNDGTVNHPNGILMAQLPIGRGDFVIYADTTPFTSEMISISGESYYCYQYKDHPGFRHNIYNWLKTSSHSLSKPIIQSPNGGETLNQTTMITWNDASDTWGLSVVYDVFISDDSSTWIPLAIDLVDSEFEFDPIIFPEGTTYKIQVVAKSEGLSNSDQSDTEFAISHPEDTTSPDAGNFLENFLNSFKDSKNWAGMGSTMLGGLLIGGLLFGIIGGKRKGKAK